MNYLSPKTLLVTAALLATIFAFSQEGPLNDQYNTLKEKSETYEMYKVIQTQRLDAFWSSVNDTLSAYGESMTELKQKIFELEDQLSESNSIVEGLNQTLEESETRNSTIAFLGIDFEKWVYHLIVWILITALLVAGIVNFIMFKQGKVVTDRSVKELTKLTEEFESFKDKSREKHIKLKRELQTAVNALDEARRSKSVRSNVS